MLDTSKAYNFIIKIKAMKKTFGLEDEKLMNSNNQVWFSNQNT